MPYLDLKKVGQGRRKKKRLKGNMDNTKGYGDDIYSGGDFNEERAQHLCSICKKPSHNARFHMRARQ